MEFLTQNLTGITEIFLTGVAALSFFFALRNEILSLKGDVTHIKENQRALAEAFTQLGNILTKVAVQDVRINMIEKKIDEITHGQGFITTRK